MDKGVIDEIISCIRRNPAKSLGTTLGFLTGLGFLVIGFWRTVLLWVLTLIGYAIGKWMDDEGKGLRDFLEERLPGRPDFR